MHRSDQSRALGDFQIRPAVFTLDKVIRSDPRVVEGTASEITTALTRLDGFDDAEPVALAIREALNNALVHGNRCDPGKNITISISINCGGSQAA
jgi:hypothetical protein